MLWSAVLFVAKPMTRYLAGVLKIGRSMAIVAETERIPNRRNSPLNSRAQISDGSGRRFLMVRQKIFCCWINVLLPLRTTGWVPGH